MAINLPLTIGASLAAPILTHFLSSQKIQRVATTRNVMLGAVTTFFVLTIAQVAQDQSQPVARVTVSAPSTSTARPITLASPVSVSYDSYVSHPIDEFYSGAPGYPSSQHIYVD